MISLKREASNGKIALEFVLTALPVFVTKTKDVTGNNLLSTHCYVRRQNLAFKTIAPELNEVPSQSVQIIV